MNRKIICTNVLLLVFLLSLYFSDCTYSHAAAADTSVPFYEQSFSEYEEAEEGYFIITSTVSPAAESDISPLSATKELSYTKTVNYYDTNNTLCWVYTLKGTFSVKIGTSATCTKVTAAFNNKKPSKYSVASENRTKSGNTCTGTISMKNNTSGSITTRKTTITCSKDGKFS